MPHLRRPALARWQLLLFTAAWIATAANVPTIRQFAGSASAGPGAQGWLFALGGWSFVLTVTLALLALAGLFFWRGSVRWMCAGMLLLAATLGYFSTFLGIQFDKAMLPNLLQTHGAEALELVNPRLLAWVAVVGGVPALAAMAVRIRPQSWRRTVAATVALVLLPALFTAALVYARYPAYASAARNRDITFATVAPANLLAASIQHFAITHASHAVRAPRGADAHPAYPIPKPRLLVLVLGETTRAASVGLNGYERQTTPRMQAAGGLYFADTQSCGTATAISLPCIFSGFARRDFTLLKGLENETLIDVALHAGTRVLWLDNDSGCKGVCDRAEVVDLSGASDPRWCPEPGECRDEILLDGLQARIEAGARDTLVVLHVKGSHGPAYHKRYPEAFERFSPACHTSDLAACSREQLRNAYDNTVLYTDHVVGETIALLRRISERYATALLYVSDHGESLGEAGLYLHGMPYLVAPAEQTRVPMYAWISPEFMALERWDAACMARQPRTPRSHDNVYATVLGLLEVQSVEYKPELDIFEACDPDIHSIAGRSMPQRPQDNRITR